MPFTAWREVFVGCSGSFRFDRAVKDVHPSVRVHSNDLSLLSCSLGAAAIGTEFPITFTGRLAFIEEALVGRPFAVRVGRAGDGEIQGQEHLCPNPFAHY